MKEPIIIKELGKIWGRDAIYLDKIEFEGTYLIKLIGEINGSLCEIPQKKEWIPYEIIFKGILEFKMTELDLYIDSEYTSSFEKVINSDLINSYKEISDKLKETHNHYIFHTYDDVFQIIAEEYELKLKL
ncbi:hypothetical protein [Aureivirga sp. CE67]|uniref:hypothetical protein n=1 Tax=Aureivirga sp. CE67 TaxID=1788983 RepID=UPI0018C9C591|nr:hypothetical protein [Aureivirga sp. CE67]